jgi:hypothetical protein
MLHPPIRRRFVIHPWALLMLKEPSALAARRDAKTGCLHVPGLGRTVRHRAVVGEFSSRGWGPWPNRDSHSASCS